MSAGDAEAIGKSLELVDEADIYVGVFAHRYGYVPKGHDISVTEMEYNRAVERTIPRLIFVMDKDHPLKIEDVELGEGAVKLQAFKGRVQTENIANFFKSPADLRAHVINSLSKHHQPDLTAFHYVSDIPQPPEVYIAHPYTLLQTRRLIGRQGDLKTARDLLDEVWELAERGPYPLFHADAFNVLAQIERDAGNHAAAVEAATKAYRLAWCDGPPFAYHWGLEAARKHLAELGAPEPSLSPFDESKFEPMPEVEIGPEDEFHVGAGGGD